MATYVVPKSINKPSGAIVPNTKTEVILTDSPYTANFLAHQSISDQLSVQVSLGTSTTTGFLFNMFDKNYQSYFELIDAGSTSIATNDYILLDLGRLCNVRGGLVAMDGSLSQATALSGRYFIMSVQVSSDLLEWRTLYSYQFDETADPAGTGTIDMNAIIPAGTPMRWLKINQYKNLTNLSGARNVKIYDVSLFI